MGISVRLRASRFGGTDFALRKERSQERPAQRAGLDEARGVSRERSLAGCLGRVSQLPHPGGVTITRVTIYGVRLSMPPPDAEDVCQHERDGRSVAATRRAQPPDHLIGAASTAASATAVSQEPASLGISAEQPVSILLAKGNLCRVGRRGTRPLSPFLWRGAPVRRGPLGGLCGLITRWVGPCPDGPHGGDASRRQRSQRRSARSRAARRVPSRRRQRRRSSTRSR